MKHIIENQNERPPGEAQKKADTFEQWKEEILKLAARDVDAGLLADFRRLGPRFLNELLALNSLSDKELKRYCKLHRKKERLMTERFIELM